MYRVLIVDDEEPVLDSYAFMLEAAGPRFSLAGMARSGYEALASLRELKPDLVFMDINIPGMDGLEVIEEVHEKLPEAVFVLSTAYERFDLARRAIPLGVFAYLVKPVTKSMFMSTLDSAAALLDKRAAPRSSADAADARRLLGEALWRGMDEAEWAAHRAALGLSSDKAAVCLAEVERDAESVFARLEKALSFQYPCLLFRTLNRGLFLIPQDADKAALEKVFAEALSAAAEPGLYLGAAVAGPRRGAELHLACAEALEELRRRKGRADAAVRERLRVLALRRKFGAEPLAEARAAFGDLWREVFAVYELPVAKAKMVALFTLLMDDCAAALPGAAGAEAAGEPSFDPAPEIMALPDLASWELWAPRAFDELQERHAAARAKAYPAPLAKALQFVAERYAEQLQLSDVAEAAQVSSAYLSRLFTEHLRTPFVDYLTALRMDKAERLLRGSSLSVKETAFAVGYKDPNYFSKIFRKETGLSPSTYAEERRSGSPGKDQP